MKIIELINGPNLNLLGYREKKLYGKITLNKIIVDIKSKFNKNYLINSFQSNHEGKIIDYIQQIKKNSCGLIYSCWCFFSYFYSY